MTDEDRTVIANMRARAEQCRRLANAILDRRAADVLTNMADEVEADIRRLEAKTDPGAIDAVLPPPVQE